MQTIDLLVFHCLQTWIQVGCWVLGAPVARVATARMIQGNKTRNERILISFYLILARTRRARVMEARKDQRVAKQGMHRLDLKSPLSSVSSPIQVSRTLESGAYWQQRYELGLDLITYHLQLDRGSLNRRSHHGLQLVNSNSQKSLCPLRRWQENCSIINSNLSLKLI
jgi:hypothetical protein